MLPSRSIRLLLVVSFAILPLACGLHGEVQDPQTGRAPPGVATGAVQIMLAGTGFDGDALSDVAQLNVTVSGVTAFPVEGGSGLPQVGALGPVALLGGPVNFDLFSLQGNSMTLAAGQVPAADYNRVEVVFTAASLTLRNGEIHPLTIDTGTVDLPIDVHVDPNQTAFISLSINVRESVRLNRNNNGSLRPVLRVQ